MIVSKKCAHCFGLPLVIRTKIPCNSHSLTIYVHLSTAKSFCHVPNTVFLPPYVLLQVLNCPSYVLSTLSNSPAVLLPNYPTAQLSYSPAVLLLSCLTNSCLNCPAVLIPNKSYVLRNCPAAQLIQLLPNCLTNQLSC